MHSTTVGGANLINFSDGRGNRVIGTAKNVGDLTVTFSSENCVLQLGSDCDLGGSIHFGEPGGSVKLGPNCSLLVEWDVGTNSSILVGSSVSSTGVVYANVNDEAVISIGKDSMLSQDISLIAYDGHPIYDLTTNERVNFSKDILIGAKVWLGNGVTVLGGSWVGEGSVVGTRSVVTEEFPIGDYTVAAGHPAMMKRTGVTWSRRGNPPRSRLSFPDYIRDAGSYRQKSDSPPTVRHRGISATHQGTRGTNLFSNLAESLPISTALSFLGKQKRSLRRFLPGVKNT